MAHRLVSWFAVAVVLGGCSRASAPPAASDPVAEPVASAPVASAEPAPAEPAPAPSASTEAKPGGCAGAEDDRTRMTCEAKEELSSFVASHQSCASATECTVVTGSCPFGCYIAVAKSAEAETVKKLGALGDKLEKAGNKCMYRCMNPPKATCEAGRCGTAPSN
jgi:hypothetical protein